MARFDRVIPPGQEGKIDAVVDTHKYDGKISKGLTVRTNDPAHPTAALQLQAMIKTWVEVQPWTAAFTADLGAGAKKVLFLKNCDAATPLEVLGGVSDNRYVRPSVEKIKPGDPDAGNGEFRVILELRPEAPIGPLEGKVNLTTTNKNQRVVEIPIEGRVNGPIHFYPQTVVMFGGQPDRPVRLGGTIILQGRPDTPPFKVQKAEADDPRIALVPIDDPAGKAHRIGVSWTDPAAKGNHTGKIRIHTDNAVMPQIEIPFQVQVD